jgi:mycothiol synthase
MAALQLSDIQFRPPAFSDLEQVAALMAASDLALTGEADYAAEVNTLRAEWGIDNYNPETDAWVAVAPDGQIVGYEVAYDFDSAESAHCDGYVHPEYTGIGIGTCLLRSAEQRIRTATAHFPAERRISMRTSIYSHESAAHELFVAEGHRIIRHYQQMRITLDAPPVAPQWPSGISVRSFAPGHDERIVHAAHEAVFADHWGHAESPFEVWEQMLIRRDDFDPTLWLLAFDGDAIAGYALCYNRAEMGWLRTLGVLRAWRRRGLGEALLRHALSVFYARGKQTVGLSADSANLTGATRLYERVGMRIAEQYDMYEKVIREGVKG